MTAYGSIATRTISKAVYFLATLAGAAGARDGARERAADPGRPDPRFRFPAEKAFRLVAPEAIRAMRVRPRAKVSRLVTERAEGIVLGGLVTPLGLIQAMALYTLPRGNCGVAAIKRRLLLALRGVGLPFHELPASGCAYPRRGAMAGYFYGHPDPVLPVYWLGAEMVPAVERALAR